MLSDFIWPKARRLFKKLLKHLSRFQFKFQDTFQTLPGSFSTFSPLSPYFIHFSLFTQPFLSALPPACLSSLGYWIILLLEIEKDKTSNTEFKVNGLIFCPSSLFTTQACLYWAVLLVSLFCFVFGILVFLGALSFLILKYEGPWTRKLAIQILI